MRNRELTIRYGGLTIGGVSRSFLLDRFHQIETDHETTSVSFEVVVTAPTQQIFASYCRQLETQFRLPYQDLKITQGASTLLDLGHDAGTGFDAQPTVRKVGDQEVDSGRSRRYAIRVALGRPATTGAEPAVGLREGTVDVKYSPSRRRTVTIGGTVTCNGSTDAREQYEAIATSYCSSVLTALTGTFELVEEPSTTASHTGKTMRFVRIYKELIYGQPSATDDPEIVDQSLRISIREDAPGDFRGFGGSRAAGASNSPGTGGLVATTTNVPIVRLQTVTAQYAASVDAEETTDLEGKWSDRIKDWIVGKVRALVEGTLALIEEQPEFDFDENRISGRLVFLLSGKNSDVVESSLRAEDNQECGTVLVGVWSGKPLEKYRYQAPSTFRRTITWDVVVMGIADLGQAGARGENMAKEIQGQPVFARPGDPSSGKWATISRSHSVAPKRLGKDGVEFDQTRISAMVVQELYIEKAAVTPSTGVGGGTATGGF